MAQDPEGPKSEDGGPPKGSPGSGFADQAGSAVPVGPKFENGRQVHPRVERPVKKLKRKVVAGSRPDSKTEAKEGKGRIETGEGKKEEHKERIEKDHLEIEKMNKGPIEGTGKISIYGKLKRAIWRKADGTIQEKDGQGPREDKKEAAAQQKKKESPGKVAKGILKDVLISAGIVGGLLLVLYLYSGVWPPMVVIESSSMMHGEDSQLGVIDTGDLTLVQKVRDRSDIVTYVEATCRTNPNYGLKQYGDYGHVIVYRKNGRTDTPVIHRAIAWIEYNASASGPGTGFRGDIPDIGIYNVSDYKLFVTSYRPENYLKQEPLIIPLSTIFASTTTSPVPHSGFVTKGDHNVAQVDQMVLNVQRSVLVEPVKVEWIVGKAQGELPWFGLFKLWITGHDSKAFPESSVRSLIITVIVLVTVPIVLDIVIGRIRKRRKSRKEIRENLKKS